MTSAREEVLRRVSAALAGAGPAGTPVPRAYRVAGTLPVDGRAALFVSRLEEYGATVVETSEPAAAVRRALAEHGVTRVVVPPDLPASLRPGGVELVGDDGLGPAELDACDAVVTTCAAACADTGTIALDGGTGQGRRAISLVPDLHVCVVRRDQIVETVPELVEGLAASVRDGRPLVLVSGPSATSDIELARVEGVHGPRRLVVVLAP